MHSTVIPDPRVGDFQQRARHWALEAFGGEVVEDKYERACRFVEEALELGQTCGLSREDAARLVDYVFGRPVGEITQEVGGVMVTLAVLCGAYRLHMLQCGDVELERCWLSIEKIRQKQLTKTVQGQSMQTPNPLPGETTPQAGSRQHQAAHSALQHVKHALDALRDVPCGADSEQACSNLGPMLYKAADLLEELAADLPSEPPSGPLPQEEAAAVALPDKPSTVDGLGLHRFQSLLLTSFTAARAYLWQAALANGYGWDALDQMARADTWAALRQAVDAEPSPRLDLLYDECYAAVAGHEGRPWIMLPPLFDDPPSAVARYRLWMLAYRMGLGRQRLGAIENARDWVELGQAMGPNPGTPDDRRLRQLYDELRDAALGHTAADKETARARTGQ